MCSHCHTLAPDWRLLSQELEGIVRIGAVNCDDEYVTCRQEDIRSYPTLMAYIPVSILNYKVSAETLYTSV